LGTASTTTALTPAVNHVEMVHRPGERELAKQVFRLLGCNTIDRGGEFVSAMVDGGDVAAPNNVLYVSEVTPEQWELEQALQAALAEDGKLHVAADAYIARLRREPQRSFHFGIRCEDRAAWDARLDAIRAAGAGAGDPGLTGRVAVSGVFFPGDPGAYTDRMAQAFVWTDVMASGLLTIGQHIELQWHRN
jgi:hypothetical protein